MSWHIAGPWSVGHLALSVEGQTSKGTITICDIRGWGHLTGQGHGALGLTHEQGKVIQEANAALIAAAPDMLHALRGVMAHLEEMEESGYGCCRDNPKYMAAHAAVGRAEGRP